MAPFEGTIMLWKQFVQSRDAYHRLHMLIRQTDQSLGDTALPAPKGTLSVEALYYNPSRNVPILRGLSFRLEAGESLGVIGPSAAGKSTLAKALVGIFAPTQGYVRLDGADVSRWARRDFGPYVGYLPQQVELFMGTIKQNIARMAKAPEDEAVIYAAKLAGVHEMILQLANGYDTLYTPGNAVLSPGQKQRIGLARALYGAPRFVVLDEPNSNLDGDGERALMAALQMLKESRVTTVIVAHRPSILTTVDKILSIRAGQVEAFGPRDEMMDRFSGGKRMPPPRGGAA
jgi:ABC-type protease/lipase transport system fused ATPase/permease subunit